MLAGTLKGTRCIVPTPLYRIGSEGFGRCSDLPMVRVGTCSSLCAQDGRTDRYSDDNRTKNPSRQWGLCREGSLG